MSGPLHRGGSNPHDGNAACIRPTVLDLRSLTHYNNSHADTRARHGLARQLSRPRH